MFTEHLSYYQRPFDERLKEIALQREDGDGVSVIICVPNPDYKPIIYRNYDESLEQYQRLLGSTHEVKKPVEPQPGFQVVSDETYQAILIDRGVIKAGSAGAVEKKDRVEDRVEKKAEVGGAGMGAGSGSVMTPNTATNTPPNTTAKKIYAKAIYGIPISQYTEEKLVTAARKHLGLGKPIPMATRKSNFIKFDKKYINHKPDDIFTLDDEYEVKKSFDSYKALKKYSETEYGSLMVDRVLRANEPFHIYTVAKRQASGSFNTIRLPSNYPKVVFYPGNQTKINASATINHEFEHTKFGSANSTRKGVQDTVGTLNEEITAVIEYENPARIIDGDEPRYVYWQKGTQTSVSVLKPNNKKPYKAKYDLNDPRILK